MNTKKQATAAPEKPQQIQKRKTPKSKTTRGKKRGKTSNVERRTSNVERGTRKPERGTRNVEPAERKAKEKPDRALSGRQEKFCHIYASGTVTATAAYEQAYGAVKGSVVSASRLLSSAHIDARINALQREAALAAVLTLQESLVYLRRAVLTPLGDVDERSDVCQAAEYQVMGGVRGKLRRGQEESGNEEMEPDMTVVKIKMVDKLKALELNAKLQGWLKDTVKLEAGDGLDELLGLIRAGK